jgi:hypothetical protein
MLSAARRAMPSVTGTPARRIAAIPLPFTDRLGSGIAMTTRLTPERMTSGTQGGVRLFRCTQGSSVT